jgi:hypothetical protein
MNNMNHQIVLKDGKSTIATWPQAPGDHPTIGDRIEIPSGTLEANAGFGGSATVSKVEIDHHNHVCRIEAEAGCKLPADQRPVITLNSSLVPENLRQEVENHVRGQVDFPILEWEDSFESKPVVRFHLLNGELRTPLETLETGVRGILKDHSELAVI